MATEAKTITSSAWTQISTGNVYVYLNNNQEEIYWVASVTDPTIGFSLDTANYLKASEGTTIALDQAIWARTLNNTIVISTTGF